MNNNSEVSSTLHKIAINCKKPKNKVGNISHLFIYGNNEKCFLSNKLVCYYTKGCFFFMCLVRLLLMAGADQGFFKRQSKILGSDDVIVMTSPIR